MHEFPDREDRLAAIARAYVRRSRRDVGGRARPSVTERDQSADSSRLAGRRARDRQEHHTRVLVARQEITGADRQWAEQYARGDVVRYTTGSRTVGLHAGEYARIGDVNAPENRVTVVRPTRRARHL